MTVQEDTLDSRRRFLKKALYVTPLVITASVRPAFASNTYEDRPRGGDTPQGSDDDGSSNWIENLVDQVKEI
jgi:hypothetical protein